MTVRPFVTVCEKFIMEGRYDDEDELRKYIGSKYQLDIWSILYFYLDLIKYCVILSLIYWGSQKCFRAFDEEKEAVASKVRTDDIIHFWL